MSTFAERRARATEQVRIAVYAAIQDHPLMPAEIVEIVDASLSNVWNRLLELEQAGYIKRTRQIRSDAGGVQYVWHLPGATIDRVFHSPRLKVKIKEQAMAQRVPTLDPLTAALFGRPGKEAA